MKKILFLLTVSIISLLAYDVEKKYIGVNSLVNTIVDMTDGKSTGGVPINFSSDGCSLIRGNNYFSHKVNLKDIEYVYSEENDRDGWMVKLGCKTKTTMCVKKTKGGEFVKDWSKIYLRANLNSDNESKLLDTVQQLVEICKK